MFTVRVWQGSELLEEHDFTDETEARDFAEEENGDGGVVTEVVRGAYSPYGDPDGYDRNGAFDGFQVYSDAEGCL